MTLEVETLEPLTDYDARSIRIVRELLPRSKRLDVAGTVYTVRQWMELEPRLLGFSEGGGKLRMLLWPDPRLTSPDAIARTMQHKGVEVAFGNGPAEFGTTDFLVWEGRLLRVLASSQRKLYGDAAPEPDSPGLGTHPQPHKDEAAQRILDRFEACWASARRVDDAALAEFRALAEASTVQFQEGDFVRSTNELYKPYGIGVIEKVRGPQAMVKFRPSVFMKPPYRMESKILLFGELEKLETPLERAARGGWEEPWRFELRMQAIRFLTGNKGGQLSNARTEILPHQIFTAHRVVTSPRRRFLLADEVGLGKTIEAGMIWQALAQRGQAKRTLIITPAGLTTQWQEEMQEKFGTFFEIFGRDFQSAHPRIWNYKVNAIASLDKLKRREHKAILLENRKWDLIIFDEAHKLSAMDYESGKVEKTQNYRLAEELRTKQYCEALLLLTATPHQGDVNHSRFINLLLLLDADISFDVLWGPTLFAGVGPSFTDYVIRTPKKEVTDAQGRKVFKGRQTHRLPVKLSREETEFYQAVADFIRTGYRALERIGDDARRRAAGFLLTTFQKLNASSTAAIKSALRNRLDRLQGSLVDVPDLQDDEFLIDERYEGEIEERQILLDEQAILEGECESLKELLAISVPRDRKLEELLRLIDHVQQESSRGAEEKVLIFTEYRETQRFLVRELEAKYGKGSVVVIHGGMKLERIGENDEDVNTVWDPFARDGAIDAPTTKRTSQRLFRDHPKVRFLVSTEAGGEGINLQFCHICVNYDLPWNPMRVEQRVGRVYRYGQNKVVQVYHFVNRGTVEDTVQTYFENRLERAAEAIAKVTGEDVEDIKGSLNGQLESEINPAKIYQRALVEGNLNKQTQQEIKEAVERAKQAYEIATRSLFRDVSSYSFDSYRKELASDLSLKDLNAFSERFMTKHRRQLRRSDRFLEFLVPDVLKNETLPERFRNATFERKLAIERSDAEFLALGHPFVDAMLGYCGSYDFGGLCTVRQIKSEDHAGKWGFLFLFVVRRRVTRGDSDECVFDFTPVLVTSNGCVDEAAAQSAVETTAEESATNGVAPTGLTLQDAFETARQHLETTGDLWDWEEDVEFLGACWVSFI